MSARAATYAVFVGILGWAIFAAVAWFIAQHADIAIPLFVGGGIVAAAFSMWRAGDEETGKSRVLGKALAALVLVAGLRIMGGVL